MNIKIVKNKSTWLVIAAVISFVLGLILWISPSVNQRVLMVCSGYLNEKTSQVTALTGLTAGLAAGISFLPGDAGTPIADILVNFSGYLLVILIALMMEKYVWGVGLKISLLVLLPVGLGLLYFWQKKKEERGRWKKVAGKFLAIAVALMLVVPCSVGLSKSVEQIFNNPVEVTINTGQEVVDETKEAKSEESNWLTKAFQSTVNLFTSMPERLQSLVESAKQQVNRLMESIAVLIITCAIIPILVYILLYQIIRFIIGKKASDDINEMGRRLKKGLFRHHEWKPKSYVITNEVVTVVDQDQKH